MLVIQVQYTRRLIDVKLIVSFSPRYHTATEQSILNGKRSGGTMQQILQIIYISIGFIIYLYAYTDIYGNV